MAAETPPKRGKPRKPTASAAKSSDRSSVVGVIDRPLGFFVLSLLIVESFLAVVIVGSNLDENHRFYCIIMGGAVFLVVVLVVFVLTFSRPQNLIYDKEAHFQERNQPRPLGTEFKPVEEPDALIRQSPPPGESRP